MLKLINLGQKGQSSCMTESDNKPSKLVSLASKRQDRKNRVRKQYLDPETRCRELEEDMLRIIDMCLELDATVSYQSKALKLLISGYSQLKARIEELETSKNP